MSQSIESPSSYMDFLPATYRQGEEDGEANLLGSFLRIFEKILTGIDDHVQVDKRSPDGSIGKHEVIGIEQILDVIHDCSDPLFTPPVSDEDQSVSDFISYLSSWVALVQNQTWDERSQRRLLTHIVPLYKRRGTEAGLSQYLTIYLRDDYPEAELTLQEFLRGIQIGISSTVGRDTVVGGAPPHFFFVKVSQSELHGFLRFSNLVANTRAIVDLEKPAHTYYAMLYEVPGMIVGERSTVAVDTLIGSLHGLYM